MSDEFKVAAGVLFAFAVWLGVRQAQAARRPRYKPGSDRLRALLRSAAPAARVPTDWADSEAIHYIIGVESAGYVGRPNYTYGERQDRRFPEDIASPDRWKLWPEVHLELRQGTKGARSTATGLGQLILDNVQAYYPEGADGIGDPWNEAVGYLAYVRSRYGSPERAAEVRRTQGNY